MARFTNIWTKEPGMWAECMDCGKRLCGFDEMQQHAKERCSSMTPNDYQTLAVRTEADVEEARLRLAGVSDALLISQLPTRLTHAVLGMLTETGEIATNFKRHIFYGKPLDLLNIKEELGDILWYIALACDATGLTLADVMQANIRKLQARFPNAYTDEHCSNRDIDAEKAALEKAILTEQEALNKAGCPTKRGE